ncbi:1-deoxy-D-xylulose-5-phosphate synthase [Caldalkalibacillus thermarum TA2.A1]|uniref:1-deoxy-D-xylulose-5-phosphate synthase n=1 Tax=Caldalkalibacillus thermarum (strain TA2.A1) TaxID=986075 RepID=A0A8X8I716_CALTT|nr:1-deoxy-D-xylulose-5-phosphate synthase [Caldalkalibacillus thermarum]QZT32659.1 1-deoxy-D-xylulose-5-phosphate synthase [Caldalkalibacillus thermarum TA2.A1]
MRLKDIKSPAQIKNCSPAQLNQLAAEIRQFLIEKLSKTGGHLAPNLGVVELTLVLHKLFDSPKDKIIWDVGHQAYIHKILTGRMDKFDTLRQYKGLCGFPKRSESEHDIWETGHSSTSLSAAMGMAIARDLRGLDYYIVAVIGDGAMTGGMALEALNHIGHEQKDIIVVLNDNEMSISPNVGALHNHLGKLRTAKHYKWAKEEIEYLIKKIPAIGGTLARTAERVKDSLKYLLVSGIFFEELGYTYLGPIDGHNVSELETCFRQAKRTKGPVLMHVVTKKGKGYAPAEADSDTWHGAGPYKIESGELIKPVEGPPNYKDVFGQAMIELAERDERIVAITPAMSSGSGLNPFAERFPDRFYDVGIAEQHAVTMSGGLAVEGMKPVCAIYSTFLQRGYDQVIHDIVRQNLDVCLAIDRAGLVGGDGETHQGVYDIGYLRMLPNIKIMMGKDENEFRNLLYTALHLKGPTAVRFPRGNGVGVPIGEFKLIEVGTWEMLEKGHHVAILAVGPMVQLALKARDQLAKEGLKPYVVNARFIKPLDEKMLKELADQGLKFLTVEEHAVSCGFGSAVLEFFNEQGYEHITVKRLGIPDVFVEHGSVAEQRREVGLTVENIVHHVKQLHLRERKVQRA